MGLRVSPCRRAGAGETAESKQELGGSFIGGWGDGKGSSQRRKQKAEEFICQPAWHRCLCVRDSEKIRSWTSTQLKGIYLVTGSFHMLLWILLQRRVREWSVDFL